MTFPNRQGLMFQNFNFKTYQQGSVHHKTLFVQIEHRELEQIKKNLPRISSLSTFDNMSSDILHLPVHFHYLPVPPPPKKKQLKGFVIPKNPRKRKNYGWVYFNTKYKYIYIHLRKHPSFLVPSSKLTYPTWGKGKSSSKVIFDGIFVSCQEGIYGI